MTAIISRKGEVLQLIHGNPETIKLNKPPGCLAVTHPPRANMYYRGWWVDMPKQPSSHHIFDYVEKRWTDPRSLDQIKLQKWSEIKNERDAAEYGGFLFLDLTFDSDITSQTRIIVASDLGIPIEWTLKSNEVVLLNVEQLKALKLALAQHISSCHERGRLARKLIYEAETIEKVNSIKY